MRRTAWLIIFVVLCGGMSAAQSDPQKVNFGSLHNQLLSANISQEVLETILNTFASMGDKDLVLTEVFKTMLNTESSYFADSLIDFYLNDFSNSDREILEGVPNVVDDWRANVPVICMMSIFGKAYLEDISWLQAMVMINSQKNDYFPHLPDDREFPHESIGGFYNMHSYSKWYIEHPEEFDYFLSLIRTQAYQEFNDSSDEGLKRYIEHVYHSIQNRYSVGATMLPPLDIKKYITDKGKVAQEKQLRFAEYCNKGSIADFISESYYLIYQEYPDQETIEEMAAYIDQNDLYKPELVFLALLRSKYE